MITVILPATNHKPDWVELHVDGQYVGRLWAHSVEAKVENQVRQFQVTVRGELGLNAFIWADTIQQAEQ